MKRILAIFLLAFAVASGSATGAPSPDPRTMTFPPLKFQVPRTERIVLDNGMVVHLLEDRELPIVSITAYIGTGSAYESPAKTGLAALTGAVLRSGGTAETTPEQMDEELEFMASSIETSIGTDAGTASMSCLKRNLGRTLQLFSQVLMKPVFRADRVELARKRLIETLRRENDSPKEIADRELNKAIYRGTPLGRHPSPESVMSITREDLAEFHRKFFHPNNIIMGVAGDFSREEIVDELNRAFGSWGKAPVSFPRVDTPETARKPELLLVRKEISQSVIRMGHLGIDKSSPDMYALRVMNFILGGGGFDSKLMAEIRTRQGLAYNVESDYSIGRRFPGKFTAETETKAESTARTIGLMQSIIEGMRENPVTEAEVSRAKESMINSFIFGFTSSASVASQKAMLEYYGYPEEYLDSYRENIAKVTKDDVLRVARKHLRPEAMTLVIVGDEKKFDRPLSIFGKVTEIRLNELK